MRFSQPNSNNLSSTPSQLHHLPVSDFIPFAPDPPSTNIHQTSTMKTLSPPPTAAPAPKALPTHRPQSLPSPSPVPSSHHQQLSSTSPARYQHQQLSVRQTPHHSPLPSPSALLGTQPPSLPHKGSAYPATSNPTYHHPTSADPHSPPSPPPESSALSYLHSTSQYTPQPSSAPVSQQAQPQHSSNCCPALPPRHHSQYHHSQYHHSQYPMHFISVPTSPLSPPPLPQTPTTSITRSPSPSLPPPLPPQSSSSPPIPPQLGTPRSCLPKSLASPTTLNNTLASPCTSASSTASYSHHHPAHSTMMKPPPNLLSDAISTPQSGPSQPYVRRFTAPKQKKNGGKPGVFKRGFPCHICDKIFGKKNHVARHISAVHLNVRPWVCGICGFPFQEKRGLARHLRVHERSQGVLPLPGGGDAMGVFGGGNGRNGGMEVNVGVGFGRRRWGNGTTVGNGVTITRGGECILVGSKVIKRHVIGSLRELNTLRGS